MFNHIIEDEAEDVDPESSPLLYLELINISFIVIFLIVIDLCHHVRGRPQLPPGGELGPRHKLLRSRGKQHSQIKPVIMKHS